ncbi:OsmC family protein [Maioricimonas rarisocia]|nr:OsmC family protein [Maioricimonas rarisocia]
MDSQQLRDLQAPLKQKYREQPEAARATLSAKGELDLENVSCRLQGRGETVAAGLHPLAGGDEKWACSGEMLLEALAACAGVTLCAVVTAMDLPVTAGTVVASGDIDFTGTLGVDRTAPVGLTDVRVHFELETTADDAQLAKLAQLTERYCVVAQTISAGGAIGVAVTKT